jgi:hypothetical protein
LIFQGRRRFVFRQHCEELTPGRTWIFEAASRLRIKLERATGLRYQWTMMSKPLNSRIVLAVKILGSLLPLGLLLFTGCARNYTITLTNGTQLGAKGKPHLKEGAYYFKDANGRDATVAAGRVSQIEPASSAKQGEKSGFIGSPSK